MSYRNAALPVAERVADLLTRMTIDEKIVQLFQTFITDENREEIKQQIRATGLGSRILAAKFRFTTMPTARVKGGQITWTCRANHFTPLDSV